MNSSTSQIDESVEMRLWTNNIEKAQVTDMEELFSIFVATEKLEIAYIKDAMTPEVYRLHATNLISKWKHLIESFGWDINGINKFLDDYGIRNLSKAYRRLVIDKIDAIAIHGRGTGNINNNNDTTEDNAMHAFETTSALITALDSIKLLSAVDEILGTIRTACDKLNAIPFAPEDWPARKKIINWLRILSSMRASDIINDDDKRQMASDVETVYEEFGKLLSAQRNKK